MSDYSDLILADGPSLYWRLGESSGTNANDETANNRDGTYTGGFTLGVAGALTGDANTAVSLDGIDAIVASSYNPYSGVITVEGWAYVDDYGSFAALFGSSSINGPALVFSGAADITFFINASAGPSTGAWTDVWPGLGQWVHWVFIHDEPGDTCELFINGVSVGSKAIVGSYHASPGNIQIGRYGGAGDYLDHSADEFAVYASALTPTQIAEHYDLGINGPPAPPPAAPLPPSVRELPPLRLMADAQVPSGQHFRWGADEPSPANAPSGIGFSTSVPGGFDTLSLTLPRKPKVAYADLVPLTTLTMRGAGGQVAWQGRLESSPRVSGSQMAITPGAVGWKAHLDDNSSARMIYVDRDLSRWGGMSRARTLALLTGGYSPLDGQVTPDPSTGIPALFLGIPGNASTTPQSDEMLYDAGAGLAIGSIYYDFVRGTNSTASYEAYVFTDDADTWPSRTITANLCASASSAATLAAGASDRYAGVQLTTPAGDGGTDGLTHDVTFRRMTVWGNHGLTKRGTAPSDGLYASDVVAHAVRTWAPLLDLSTGVNGTVTDTSFIIPQLLFTDPTTASEIISGANRYHLRDWAVWESSSPTGRPTFYYYDRGARGKAWRARVAASGLSENGPSIEDLWNGAIGRFQDVDGTTKTVGPPGSGCDTTSTACVDPDPLNPATQAGVKRWAVIDLGGVSTPAGATEVVRRFIAETAQFNTSGRAQITGHVQDDRGVTYPAWRIRGGDTITFVDASDTSARRVVRTQYDDASKTNSIDLDSPPEGLEALLQRLQVVLVGTL